MNFIETRGNDGKKPKEVTFAQAILNPSASFGGLYAPKEFPKVDYEFLKEYKNKSYKELALKILKLFEIDIEENIIKEALDRYDLFDDPNEPTPLKQIEDNLFVCELWHGPTRAFKDMALQPFGVILSHLAKKEQTTYLILAATSGDTGPAALSTFENKDFIKVVCMYPNGGTSDVQRLQMVTMSENNLKVIGINGNFDDAQNALKELLASDDFKEVLNKKKIKLSAANSVNFGRIIFQIVYHFYSYLKLLQEESISLEEEINLIVPSGNFGNALGAYYAKKMGLPIKKIIIASNANNVLTQLITKGIYDIKDKKLIKTTSPAMDILKSSNVERVLFDLFGDKRTKELMQELELNGFYRLDNNELEEIQHHFSAICSTDLEVAKEIKNYAKKGYIMDTHTATCIKAYKELTKVDEVSVLYSTAQWTKFAPTVYGAISDIAPLNDEEAIKKIENEFNVFAPKSIKELFKKKINHKTIVNKEDIKRAVSEFL
jgi:threonine synthase